MSRKVLTLVASLWLAAAGLSAQESPREILQRALSPQVFREFAAFADEMSADGIPTAPLYAKALEGAAKSVPPDRILPAVRAVALRLREARQALGPGTPAPLLIAGADALQRGVTAETLRGLPDGPRSVIAITVLADLLESGVPADRALAILREIMAQRPRDDRVLDMSARVKRLIRQGVAPQDAVDRVRRNLQRARDGSLGPPVPPGSEPTVRDRVRDGVNP